MIKAIIFDLGGKIVLEKTGVKGNEAVFIDDRPENLPPAQDFGMQTLLFEDPKKLKDDIYKLLGEHQ